MPQDNTFCPAKWDELIINLNYNYVYSCCKATPIHFVNNYNDIIKQQKQNLLLGTKDPSCQYCWQVEDAGKKSLRQTYLEQFDHNTYNEYLNLDKNINVLEINLGNACNMQCQYCNPKFSSEWEKDIKYKPYPIFIDRYHYEIKSKNKKINKSNLDLIEIENPKVLRIIGGEPLVNNNFWRLLDKTKVKKIRFASNFMVNQSTIEKLIEYEHKFDRIDLLVSLDCTAELAEYVRYGLNFNTLVDNLRFYLTHSANPSITIISLMTAITVLDIDNFSNLILELKSIFPNKQIQWVLSVCSQPLIQSFASLPVNSRTEPLNCLQKISKQNFIIGADTIIAALENTEFKLGIHKQFTHFINEWEKRKAIELPQVIKKKLCLV